VIRLATYLVSCAALGLVLWWMAASRPVAVMALLWVVAWVISLIVTWNVARRDGLNPLAWCVVALLIGPLAWVAMAALRPGSASFDAAPEPRD
jgi:hypothetical protein